MSNASDKEIKSSLATKPDGDPLRDRAHTRVHGEQLIDTTAALFANDKGLLAIDESIDTCNRRFAELGIPQTEESRSDWRELIVTTPDLNQCISGVILFDETIRQKTRNGGSFVGAVTGAGLIPGIKVDIGATDMAGHPGEKVTEGLDGLQDRLDAYSRLGARFAKWRGEMVLGGGRPTQANVEANAHALARYAALCQQAGLVPIVEPEVLMDGDHTLQESFEATERVLRTVFDQLYVQGVSLDAVILKPNMVLPGLRCPRQETIDEIADVTIDCLARTVPVGVPAIAFGLHPEKWSGI